MTVKNFLDGNRELYFSFVALRSMRFARELRYNLSVDYLLVRLIITFTSNVKREFVPRDEVSHFTCRLPFSISTHK